MGKIEGKMENSKSKRNHMAGSNIMMVGGWEGSQEVISYEMCIFNNALEGIKETELL